MDKSDKTFFEGRKSCTLFLKKETLFFNNYKKRATRTTQLLRCTVCHYTLGVDAAMIWNTVLQDGFRAKPLLIQALLALASPMHSHILILENEQQCAMYDFVCLPFEMVVVAGKSYTAYCVIPREQESEHEWMYTVQESTEAPTDSMLDACWLAYKQSKFTEAKEVLMKLRSLVPEWYLTHLQKVIERK